MNASNENRSAFTLLDLLIIVMIFAIFGALLLPAFAQEQKSHTLGLRCLANHAELIKAWQMYAADSDEYVANNYTLPGTLSGITKWKSTGVADNWAPNVMVFSAGGSLEAMSTTNTALAQAGLLVPYHKNIGAYQCPADTYVSRVQKFAGWKLRLRSVSMNSNWGRSDPSETKDGIATSWAYGAPFRQWHKLSDIRKPKDRFVFLDEHADSINDGFFVMSTWNTSTGEYPGTASSATWGDVPGFYHYNSTPFGFADGHAEMKSWFSRAIPVKADGTYTSGRADIRDQQWYVQHVVERR